MNISTSKLNAVGVYVVKLFRPRIQEYMRKRGICAQMQCLNNCSTGFFFVFRKIPVFSVHEHCAYTDFVLPIATAITNPLPYSCTKLSKAKKKYIIEFREWLWNHRRKKQTEVTQTYIACDYIAWDIGVGQNGVVCDAVAMQQIQCKAMIVRRLASFPIDCDRHGWERCELAENMHPNRLGVAWIVWTNHPILSIVCPPSSLKTLFHQLWFLQPDECTQHTDTQPGKKNWEKTPNTGC